MKQKGHLHVGIGNPLGRDAGILLLPVDGVHQLTFTPPTLIHNQIRLHMASVCFFKSNRAEKQI